MKELLIEYCEYNIWATDRLFATTMELAPELHTKELESSFPTVSQTWLHIWSGQYVWMQRIKGENISQRPAKTFDGSMQELLDGMRASSQEWLDFVKGASEEQLLDSFTVEGRSGNKATFVYKDLVMQVMNHGTYHRGQIVTMLRQLGATDLPSTDWARFMGER